MSVALPDGIGPAPCAGPEVLVISEVGDVSREVALGGGGSVYAMPGGLPGRVCCVRGSCADASWVGRSEKSSQQESRRRALATLSLGFAMLAARNSEMVYVPWWFIQGTSRAAGA